MLIASHLQVAKGSTGLVYEGIDINTQRRVAVKKLDLGKQTDIPALENEIAMMNLSKHTNIGEESTQTQVEHSAHT